MSTILLTWNANKFDWKELPKAAKRVQSGISVKDQWTCRIKDTPTKGYRFFLMKQGQEPRGIIASGRTIGKTFIADHWDDVLADRGVTSRYVSIKYDMLLNPDVDMLLSRDELRRQLRDVDWDTQSSGMYLSEAAANVLESLWRKHLKLNSESTGMMEEELSAMEGEAQYRMTLHRKREAKLREAKIEQVLAANGRLACEVPNCGFDFFQVYGDLGKDYAQVHHDKPLGSGTTSRRVTLSDLHIVCANCHVMIHRNGECRPLKTLIPAKKKN